MDKRGRRQHEMRSRSSGSPGSPAPVTGSQCSCREKISSRKMPRRSRRGDEGDRARRARYRAASPASAPRCSRARRRGPRQITIAQPASCRVLGKTSRIDVADRPVGDRHRCRNRPARPRRKTTTPAPRTERSRPMRSAKAARSSGVARGPSRMLTMIAGHELDDDEQKQDGPHQGEQGGGQSLCDEDAEAGGMSRKLPSPAGPQAGEGERHGVSDVRPHVDRPASYASLKNRNCQLLPLGRIAGLSHLAWAKSCTP